MSIILSAIKRSLRDKMSILSAMFMMIILPAFFSMMYSHEERVEDVRAKIIAKEKTEIIKLYIETIKTFDEGNDKVNIDYKIEYTPNIEEEVEKLETNPSNKNLQIIIDEKNKKVDFKNSNNLNIAEAAIQSVTEEFFNQMTIYEVAAKSSNTPNIVGDSTIKTTKFEAREEINYDSHFTTLMLQMAILVGSVYAFKNTFYIKEDKGIRVFASPIKPSKLLILESVGSFIVIAMQAVVLLALSYAMYDVKVNLANIVGIMANLLALTTLAVGMGIFSTAISSKKVYGENIVSVITLIFVYASGKLMPQFDAIKEMWFVKINPLTWINESTMNLVEHNSYENIGIGIGIALVYTIVFIGISSFILKKRVVK